MNAAEQFAHWRPVRRDLLRALDVLGDEQLTFVPREGLWSLGEVACHIAGVEEGWYRYVITGGLPAWPNYRVKDYSTVEAVKRLLTEVHDRTQAYLETVDERSLDQVFSTAWGDVSLRWVIWHVLEHEIHHRGEIYLMLGLMGMEAPDV